MDCEEFLKQFREALDGKVPESVIQDNVNYYRSYIGSQATGGKREEDVLKSLGDPRLLAKTIEESSKFASERSGRSGKASGFENYGNNYNGNNSYGNTDSGQQDGGRGLRLTGWLKAVVAVAVVIFVLLIVFKAFVFLAPFILAFMAVSFLVKAVTGRWDK